MMCCVYECVCNKKKILHTCIRVIHPRIRAYDLSWLDITRDMYVLVLYHPNYKSQYVSNLVVVGESTNEHDRDGRRGHGRDSEGGRGTPEPTLPTSIPPILTHHPRFLYPHTLAHHLPYPQTLTHLYHIWCRQSQPP